MVDVTKCYVFGRVRYKVYVEKRSRYFQNLTPILDEAVAGSSVRVLGYPLPEGASSIEELISGLLLTGYGLAENARLDLGFWESDAS